MKWYVWECNKCKSTMTINYEASEEDYIRFKNCGCRSEGLLEWKKTYEDEEINKI